MHYSFDQRLAWLVGFRNVWMFVCFLTVTDVDWTPTAAIFKVTSMIFPSFWSAKAYFFIYLFIIPHSSTELNQLFIFLLPQPVLVQSSITSNRYQKRKLNDLFNKCIYITLLIEQTSTAWHLDCTVRHCNVIFLIFNLKHWHLTAGSITNSIP